MSKLLEWLYWLFNDSWMFLIPRGDWQDADSKPRIQHLSKDLRKHIRKCGRHYLQYQPLFWFGLVVAMFWLLNVIALCMDNFWIGVLAMVGFVPIYWAFYIPAHWKAIDRYLYDHSESGRMKCCLNCDYDLRGTDGDACPECGAETRIMSIRYSTRKWKMRD